ncbi:MAG: NADH-quinone oxidoreductase subunit J [Chloroflexi bacterium]|nr:NADH-quinone oxidoreductase subunit J [Chloroflexota bacterium]
MAVSDLVFWVLAIVSVASALLMIFTRNIFRSALFLVVSFFAVAGLYILLSADFLAAVQVLVYVGAIGVLIIFAIMLTRELGRANRPGKTKWPALVATALLFGLLSFSILNTDWRVTPQPSFSPTTEALGLKLYSPGGFVFPFEIASVLLLAAIIGAIVLVRER